MAKSDDQALESKQQFWRILFEEQKLACQLPKLAKETSEAPATFDVSFYGKVEVKVQHASTLGDNFLSDAYAIEARVIRENIGYSSFAKILPSNTIIRESAKEWNIHEREVKVYSQLFGEIRSLFAEQTTMLDVPDLYFSKMGDRLNDGLDNCIVMENLKIRGYRMANKLQGADDAHVRIALTSLAQYHSLTLAAVRQWSDSETKTFVSLPSNLAFLLEKTVYEINPAGLMKGWMNTFINFSRELDRSDLVEWFEGHSQNLKEILIADNLQNTGAVTCVLHGDFWINNLLFEYDEGENPIGVKIVDFQNARIGHPLSDILYFVYSSAKPDERELYMQDWLRTYYDALEKNLKMLRVKLEDYERLNFYADAQSRIMYPMLLASMLICVSLDQKVVDELNDSRNDEKQKETEANALDLLNNVSGTSSRKDDTLTNINFTKTLINIMNKNKIIHNPIISYRLRKLWDEAKQCFISGN